MTFLLQKFNAINRSRTEVRARNGLRSSASGIAFTSRLAACLLLAGFLGVGSAIAQPHVLRMGDGSISVEIGDNQVHHYLIDTDGDGDYSDETLSAAGTDPTGRAADVTEVNTFLVGGIALATWTSGSPNTLMITPVSTGGFKVATSPTGADDLTDADDAPNNNNPGTPYAFVVLSGHAPTLLNDAGDPLNNAAVQDDVVTLALIPRDDTSKKYDLLEWFSDPNDVFLDFDASVDMVAKAVAASPPDMSPLRPKVTKDGVAIVSATRVGNDLTIALTKEAMMLDQTDIWVFGRDGSEYARKRIQVTVGTSTNPWVDTALPDRVLREEDNVDPTVYALSDGFMDPDVDDASVRQSQRMDAMALEFAVEISDDAAQKVGTGDSFTLVTSYMVATVTQGATASVSLRPRAVGSVMFTVTATDKGLRCKDTFEFVAKNATSRRQPGGGDAPEVDRCIENSTSESVAADADSTGLYPDSKSIKDDFTLSIISRTTPLATEEAITAPEGLVADGDAKTLDLEDLNGDKAKEPAAFEDGADEGLTYTMSTVQSG